MNGETPEPSERQRHILLGKHFIFPTVAAVALIATGLVNEGSLQNAQPVYKFQNPHELPAHLPEHSTLPPTP
jgi:hypothetical protein